MKVSTVKALFEPLAELKMEGTSLELLAKGLVFFDAQFGVTAASVKGIGECICDAAIPRSSQVCPSFLYSERECCIYNTVTCMYICILL